MLESVSEHTDEGCQADYLAMSICENVHFVHSPRQHTWLTEGAAQLTLSRFAGKDSRFISWSLAAKCPHGMAGVEVLGLNPIP